MLNNILLGVAVHFLGGLFLLAGIFNWDFFYKDRGAKILIMLITRTGARIFYGVSGGIFIYGYYAIILGYRWQDLLK